jgi:hypothetical protein
MKNNKIHISEATSTSSGSRGSYNAPLSIGIRLFNKQAMQPYYVPTSEYDDAMLAYDSYDGEMSTPKKVINKIEKLARKIAKKVKDNPVLNDDDGDILNNKLGKVNEWIEIRSFNEGKHETRNLQQIIKDTLLQERKNP